MRLARRNLYAIRRTGLWRDQDYVKFWSAQSISAAGSQISLLAIPILAVVSLGANSVQMGFLVAAGTSPILLIGLFAGVWTDRLRRRPILIAADFGRAALLLLIPLPWWLGSLRMELLYVVAFLTGSLSVFFDIARQSYVPVLVQRDQPVEANQKVMLSASAAEVAGPGIAGALIKLIGAPLAILLDAWSFAASGLLLLRIGKNEKQIPRQEQRRHLWAEMREGLGWVVHDPILRTLALATGVWNFFDNARLAMLILFLTRVLHLGPSAIGVVFMLGSIGYFAGAFLPTWTSNRFGLGPAIMIATVVIWISQILYLFAFGPRVIAVPLVVAALFLEGFGAPSYDVNQVSLRQAITPDKIRGRVNASLRVLIRGTVPLGALAGGLVADQFGLRAAIAMGAIGPPIALYLIWASPVRDLQVPPPPVEMPESATATA